MSPRRAVKIVKKSGFSDEPGAPVRDQMAEEASSMVRWAGLYIVLFALPLMAWQYNGSAWTVVLCAIFLGKGLMYAYEAVRLRNTIRCFDRHNARTLEDLLAAQPDVGEEFTDTQ